MCNNAELMYIILIYCEAGQNALAVSRLSAEGYPHRQAPT